MDAGIPKTQTVLDFRRSPEFMQIEEYSDEFIRRHAVDLAPYARKYVADPLHAWSRVWEYPFVANRIAALKPKRALDAGSGVTFFPWYLGSKLGCDIVCCDMDVEYPAMFQKLNSIRQTNVQLVVSNLGNMPLESASFDAVFCVSVLEHAPNHAAIVDEFSRILVTGGHLLMTYDICLDGHHEISPARSDELMSFLEARFDLVDGGVGSPSQRCTDPDAWTTHVAAATAPESLPPAWQVRPADPGIPWPPLLTVDCAVFRKR